MEIFQKKIKETIIGIFCFLFRWSEEKPTVLMYHSICDGGGFLSLSPKEFESQIKWLRSNNFNFLKTSDLSNVNNIPKKSVLITFDDGYEDNFLFAFPILEKYKIPAIFFITAGVLDKEMMGMRMMSWEQIKKILVNPLFEVGGHGFNHKRFSGMEKDEVVQEILLTKKLIKENLNRQIEDFSYPFGRFNKQTMEALKNNNIFRAFTIEPSRLSKKNFNHFFIPRVGINNQIFSQRYFKDVFKAGFGLYWRIRRWFLKVDN
jgi:peptidoglycan/xylan/chitin deacetylase (PgdA/CDA1 family)